ncbi:MAG TPA: hypothetical protein VFY23_09615 [Candidatus Limnocylindrales bacterium]|nr:hypothetical protein [Candidatus Limnocylindrales bacterium]
MRTRTSGFGRLGLVVAGVLISASSLALPVAAQEAIDPGTLNPPPPDFINPECGWAGQQVICSFGYEFTVTDATTGIFCGGGEVLESSDRSVTGQRLYDDDLNMTGRRFRERIDGVLYVAETGASVRWTGTDTGIEVLSVPGDRSTGVRTNSGAIIHLYLDDGGSVALAGRAIEDLDTGDLQVVGANTTYDLCDALQ